VPGQETTCNALTRRLGGVTHNAVSRGAAAEMDILAERTDEGYKLGKRLSCTRPPLEALGTELSSETMEELNLLILRLPTVPDDPPIIADNDTSSPTSLITKAATSGAQALVSSLGWLGQRAWGGGGNEKT